MNAIFETAVSSHLLDRFEHDASPAAPAHTSLEKPVSEPRGFEEYYTRACAVLRRQWLRRKRPEPAFLYDEGGGEWIVATCEGRALRCSRAARQRIGYLPRDILLALGADGTMVRDQWKRFVARLRSGAFKWSDFLVLQTDLPDLCLLCRPISTGSVASEPVAVMIEIIDLHWFAGAHGYLGSGLGLSRDQARILVDVLKGVPLASLGQGRFEQILTLTGVPGGSELVRLAAFLLDEHASDLAIAGGDKLPPSHQIETVDGRRLQYLRLGAETGHPVIFMHGVFDCLAGVLRLQPQFRKLGFRVYVPFRSGYGNSGPMPDGQKHLEVFGDQLEALMAHEKMRHPILLAHRGGMVFAKAAVLRWGNRIAGVVAVSPFGPVKSLKQFAFLRGYQRAFALCSSFARPLLPLMMRIWSRSVRKDGVNVLLSRQVNPAGEDAARVANLNLAPLLRHSHDFAMRQGGAGFLADIDIVLRDLQPICGRPGDGPLLYLYGSKDAAVMQGRPAGVPSLGQNIQYRQCDGDDGTLLYTRPELILAALEELSVTTDPVLGQGQPYHSMVSNT